MVRQCILDYPTGFIHERYLLLFLYSLYVERVTLSLLGSENPLLLTRACFSNVVAGCKTKRRTLR